MTLDLPTLTTIILASLPGLAALVAAILAIRAAKGKRNETAADIKKTDINGQSIVITNLAAEVGRLSARVAQLEVDYTLLGRKYDHVLAWAMPRGYEPPPHW